MKIVHITPIYWDNWGYQENYLAKIQAQLGQDVTVICPNEGLSSYKTVKLDGKYDYFFSGFRVVRLHLLFNILNRFYLYKNLQQTLKDINPDIIMIHGLACLPSIQVVRYKKKNPNVTLYADFHADALISANNFISKFVLHKFIWKVVIKIVIKHFNKIYYTRPSVKRFSMEMYNLQESKLHELLLGAEKKVTNPDKIKLSRLKLRSKLNLQEEDILICTGGKIDHFKKIDFLISAIENMKIRSKLHLVIFGSVSLDYMNEYKQNIKRIDNVYELGWINEDDIEDVYHASDIAIFLGNHSVLWEKAICCGIPTIFSEEVDRTYLDLNGNNIFVKNNDMGDLTDKLLNLVENPYKIQLMRSIAEKEGLKKFSYSNIFHNLTESWK